MNDLEMIKIILSSNARARARNRTASETRYKVVTAIRHQENHKHYAHQDDAMTDMDSYRVQWKRGKWRGCCSRW